MKRESLPGVSLNTRVCVREKWNHHHLDALHANAGDPEESTSLSKSASIILIDGTAESLNVNHRDVIRSALVDSVQKDFDRCRVG